MVDKKKVTFKPGTLIHDKAPTAIRRSRKTPSIRRLDDDEEFRGALCKKIQDELSDYLNDKENGKRLADALQVLYFLAEEFHGYTPSDLDYYRDIGGRVHTFDERFYLEAIEERSTK